VNVLGKLCPLGSLDLSDRWKRGRSTDRDGAEGAAVWRLREGL
jgi:hypothetical protein